MYLRMRHGRHSWLCLLDSGCEKSIVPFRMVKHLPIRRSDEKLYAANSTRIATLGVAEVALNVAGFNLPVSAIVTEHVREPMLGIDWLRRYGCVMDYERDVIIVKGKTLKLESKGPLQKNSHR